jgi:hypothetical protein
MMFFQPCYAPGMANRTIVALAALVIYPLAAQTPRACIGQLVPLKPLAMLSCSNAAPVCITDDSGNYGYWAWMCPGNASTGPKFLDPSLIINSVPAPSPGDSIIDTVHRIYQLRQLQLKNQQIHEQNRRLEEDRKQAEEQAPPMLSLKTMLGSHFEPSGLGKLSPEELDRLNVWFSVYTTELVRLTKVQAIQEASAAK